MDGLILLYFYSRGVHNIKLGAPSKSFNHCPNKEQEYLYNKQKYKFINGGTEPTDTFQTWIVHRHCSL